MRTTTMHPNSFRFIVSFAIALAAAGFARAASTTTTAPKHPGSYRDLQYPSIHDIKVPEPVRFELANGLVVYLIEDHELPKVGMHALVRTGGR